MRTIARGNTPEACQQRVNLLKRDKWKQISEIKQDPSPTIDLSWVAVMEREENPESLERKKKRRWNRMPIGY